MNYFDKCKQCTIMVGNGTGVLFQPKEEVNYSYILTAKHTKEEVNYSYILTAKHNLENEDNIEFNLFGNNSPSPMGRNLMLLK